ncbi:ArsR/SmtB family transcription factor [Maritimibacter alexandrii]|uniref:ArsR/SmtB family transcription factor n=1 Tax=Maritimibacter alexandrii TaxID=2570355 RepID=UPI001107E404|nr:metalloregulator ArsR/SmtB family transcription factor [Maritimibacter alexandrii]
MTAPDNRTLDLFEALGHPLRLRMVEMMAAVDDLACTTLEAELPIAKSTISYHVKILSQAGLIDVRRDGRWFNYRLRRDVLKDQLTDFAASLDQPRQASDARHSPAGVAGERAG